MQPKCSRQEQENQQSSKIEGAFRTWNPDDDSNAFLKDEEHLVNAHPTQVEDTMDIVEVELNLLVKGDQPTNQLDDYIIKLNTVLSQKVVASFQVQNCWLIFRTGSGNITIWSHPTFLEVVFTFVPFHSTWEETKLKQLFMNRGKT